MRHRLIHAKLLIIAATAGIAVSTLEAQSPSPDHRATRIEPGESWMDDRGLPIQAHGGGILRVGKTFFWFGEDRSPGNDPEKRYVACYSSKDLVRWKFRRQALQLSDPEQLGKLWVVERPKVFHNAKTGKFVMYFHLDAPGPDGHGYTFARVGIATSDTVDGDYRYLKSFRPLGKESRDIGQFVDDDGSPYLIFESRPTGGFFIASLTDDYLSADKQVAFIHAPLEGGALVHYHGMYYVTGSHLTGWNPNPNVYATAASLAGPWTEFKDIAPSETNTYDSQSTALLKVAGRKATTVIYMGDRWKPKALWDSRYIWMPLVIDGLLLRLPPPAPWKIDVVRGTATVEPTP
jgi:hypothetical protein